MKRNLVFFGLISALLVVFLAGCFQPVDPDSLTAASAFDLTALVTAPVNGAAPATTIGVVAQYTGTISWQPPHSTFVPSTVYQATITLTTTTGYTFVGVGANSFSYTGATSITNVAGSGGTISITIIFPATISPPTGQQLAEDFNAVSPGSASVSGDTVTLLKDLAITGPITVPSGVTLDLASNHKSLTLGDNAVLTVDGAINAEAARNSTSFIAGNGKLLVNSAVGNPATINGAGVIHLKSQGSLLFIENGKGLILDGVTLDGLMTAAAATEAGIALPTGYEDDSNNNLRLVEIMQGAALTMQSGVIGYNGAGGVGSSGVFNMYGGEIKNNYIFGGIWKQGAGIYVQATGVFTMYGGEIKGNNAEDEGGGVYVTQGNSGSVILHGTFIMAGGTVYGSSAGPGLANITGVSPRGGAALYAPGGNAWWGDGSTVIPSKSYQEGTLHGGTPTGTVGSPETNPPEDSTVNALNLTALVIAPERNATPNTTAINTTQYTGTIAWQPTHSTFAPSTAYQATVSLTAKTGYTFAGLGANSFTHADATTTTNPAGNGTAITVTISFPQTAAAIEPVTDITGVPSSGTVGVNLALSGTISPADATNQDIAWSVNTSETTAAGASIAGNTLSTTGTGIVVVTATIANGTAVGTDYTKDFTITIASVSSSSAEQLAADLNAIVSGSASASGETVTLLKDLAIAGSITVPPGVTLDLASSHKSLTLGNDAVLTVDGAINAEAARNSTSFIAGNGKLLVNSAIGSPATINGAGVIHLKSQGSLLFIENGKGLILDGVTLDGLMTATTAAQAGIALPAGYEDDSNNNLRLVEIMQGAALTMQSGVIGYNGAGGVGSSGVFDMYGGEIKNNYIFGGIWKQGAGIYVQTTGVFTMYDGEIKGNNAEDEGGGVYVTAGGTFIMAGGTVYGSSAEPGLANITGVSQRGGAALYSPIGRAWWGNGVTEIPSKSYQEETLYGGTPTGTVGSPETNPPEDSTVNALNLTALVTAPVNGAAPATTIGVAAQYSGTISWQPAHSTFVPSTTYQATVSLMATAGYTFTGVGANSFIHTGAATITNAAGSGTAITVTIRFPETEAPAQYTITLNLDAGDGVFSQDAFAVSKSGADPTNQTVTITGSGYTNPRWYVDGDLKGTGESIAIWAADYSVGKHNLTLLITKSGVSWSKEITFTVN